MTNLKTFLAAVALTAPALAIGSAAHAQVAGIAVADPEAAVANTRAWATAKQQIETTYKAQRDQAEARRQAISTELKQRTDGRRVGKEGGRTGRCLWSPYNQKK